MKENYELSLSNRWGNDSRKPSDERDSIWAEYIIDLALREGFLSWNAYNLAKEKVDRVYHGSWMFDNVSRR